MRSPLLIFTLLWLLSTQIVQAQNWQLYKAGQRNILEMRLAYDSMDNLAPDGIVRFNRVRQLNNGTETEFYADSLLGIVNLNPRYVYESQYTFKLNSTFIGPSVKLHHSDSSWSLKNYKDSVYRLAVKALPGQNITGQISPIRQELWTLLNGDVDSVKAFKLEDDTLYLSKRKGIVGYRGYRYSEFQYVPTIRQLFDKSYVQSYWNWSRNFFPAYSIDTVLTHYVFHSKRVTQTHTVFTYKADSVESRVERFYMNPRALYFDSIVYYYSFSLAINPYVSDSIANNLLDITYMPDSLISGIWSFNTLTRKQAGIERGIRRTELDRLPNTQNLFGRGPLRHGNSVEDYFPFTGLSMRLHSGWASAYKQEVVQYTDTSGRTFGTKPRFRRTRLVVSEPSQQHEQRIHMYPNPTTGQVTVRGDFTEQTLVIMNQLGQVVHQSVVTPNQSLTLQLPSGMYSYQIGKSRQKLVVR